MREQIETVIETLSRTWTTALREHMELRLPPPFSLDPVDVSSPQPPPGLAWFRQEFQAGFATLIGVSPSLLGELGELGVSAETCPESLSEGMTLCARYVESRFGMPSTGKIVSVPEPGPMRPISVSRLRLAGSEGNVWLAVEVSSLAILEQLSNGGGRRVPASQQLDVLMGLELPVSISFGTVDMPLSDVLGLVPGSIVELNHRLNEPVDVMVNNTLVAQGQVVVVDGNYGIRISKVLSRPSV